MSKERESNNRPIIGEGFAHDHIKALTFVIHIEKHLEEMGIKAKGGKVCCKICNKDIDEIYEQER